MIRNHYKSAMLAATGLVVGGLTVLGAGTSAHAADAMFTERWCGSPSVTAPCVISATLNGAALHKGDPVEVQMIPTQSETDFNYTEFIVGDPTETVKLTPTDDVSVYLDLGHLKPEYTEGFTGRPDVDRISDGDGTYRVRYSGHPVRTAAGCTETYPDYCPDVATSEKVEFDAEIHQLKSNREFVGFDRSQSADDVDGIYLNSSPSGDYLESSWNNARYYTDGTTKVQAEARFRIPYRMLIAEFKIPDPSTMVASSLIGTVNGAPATYAFSQDPKGGAVFVDISGVTFPPGTLRVARPGKVATKPRVIRVRRGTITPTAPTLTKATRVGSKARLTFGRAKARGAKVTGYQARCQAPGHKALTASGRYPVVVVKHLKAGRKYQCSVRATSKAGRGRWSVRLKV